MIHRRAFFALPALAALPGPKGLLGPVAPTAALDEETRRMIVDQLVDKTLRDMLVEMSRLMTLFDGKDGGW